MSDVEIHDELLTLLVAGHETTATQLAWTLERLTRHLGITRTTYSINTGPDGEFVVVANWCDGVSSVVGRRFSVAQVSQTIADQWRAGQVIRYDDIVGDPRVLPRLAAVLDGRTGGRGEVRVHTPLSNGDIAIVLLGRQFRLDAELAALVENMQDVGKVELTTVERRLAAVG